MRVGISMRRAFILVAVGVLFREGLRSGQVSRYGRYIRSRSHDGRAVRKNRRLLNFKAVPAEIRLKVLEEMRCDFRDFSRY